MILLHTVGSNGFLFINTTSKTCSLYNLKNLVVMSEKRIAAEALRVKLITECRFIQGVNPDTESKWMWLHL